MNDAKGVDGRCPLWVDMWWRSGGGGGGVNEVGVANIYRFFPGGETDSIRSAESICHNTNVARSRIESIYMLGQLGFRSKALFVAVDWVREPNRSIRVNDDVIGRIEGARMIIVQ